MSDDQIDRLPEPDLYRCEDKRIRSTIKEITLPCDSKLANKPSKRKYYDKCITQSHESFKSFLLKNVVDVDNVDSYGTIENVCIDQSLLSCNKDFSNSAKIYKVSEAPCGLYIIRGLLSQEAQYNWAKICLNDFSRASHTNVSNLQNINKATTNTQNDNIQESPTDIPTKAGAEIETTTSIPYKDNLKGLRWASLGYHYNWTLRMYVADQQSTFPSHLSSLCRDIASLVGLDVTPEAAIVNYYPINGQMSGHLDDAEHNMNEPIVSVSLGCSAIFLIGGRIKSIKPIPILLHSGDVIIMSDEARYCYHGVPTIIPAEYTEIYRNNKLLSTTNVNQCHESNYDNNQFTTDKGDFVIVNNNGMESNSKHDVEHESISNYLRNGRINVNVRRVTRNDGIWESKNGSGYSPI